MSYKQVKAGMEKGLVPLQFRVMMTPERKAEIQEQKRASRNSWETIVTKGIVACMEERAQVNDAIFCESYVKCYMTKNYSFVRKRRSNAEYTTIYLYWLSSASGKRLNAYFSKGEPLSADDRGDVEHWRISKGHFHESILNEFDFGLDGVLPI